MSCVLHERTKTIRSGELIDGLFQQLVSLQYGILEFYYRSMRSGLASLLACSFFKSYANRQYH